MAAGDPFVVVDDFVADGGGVAVTGIDDGLPGQHAQAFGDGVQDGREVRERPAGRARSALEKCVPEMTALRSGMDQQTDPGSARGVQRVQFDTAGAEHLAVVDGAEVLVRVYGSPQHVIGGVQQHRGVEGRAEFGATVMWSLWPWVQTTATTLRPPTASMIGAAVWAASNTTTSWSSPTIQMLLSTSQLPPSSSNVPLVTTRSMLDAELI